MKNALHTQNEIESDWSEMKPSDAEAANSRCSVSTGYATFDSAPNDGQMILAYDNFSECWKMCFGDGNGSWYGDHHSSTYGTELSENRLTHWMKMPPKPDSKHNIESNHG